MIPPKRRCVCGARMYFQSSKPLGSVRVVYRYCRECGRRKKEIETQFLDPRFEGSFCQCCGARMPAKETTHDDF